QGKRERLVSHSGRADPFGPHPAPEAPLHDRYTLLSAAMVRKRIFTFALVFVGLLTPVFGEALKVRIESERLRVSAPELHLLAGRRLERLRNGSTAIYSLQLTVRNERSGHISARVLQRFSFSYDLWEEKFTVTRLDSPTRSASNLSAARAEAWCIE